MISGVLLFFSPGAAKEIVHTRATALRSLADWQLEFGQLSHGALRLLGAWTFLMGALLFSVTTTTAVEVRGEKVSPSELRKAA